MLGRSPAAFAFLLLVSLSFACSNPKEDDLRVCAGYACSAGYCYSDNGTPRCACGAFENAAGLTCELTDRNDTPETAVVLTPDAGPVSSSLEVRYDLTDPDWYRFEAQPNTFYELDLASNQIDDLSLQSKGSVQIVGDPGLGANYFRSQGGTSEFVLLSPSGELGDYTVDLHVLGVDDHGEDLAHATPLTLGQPVAGALQAPPDVDVFSFDASGQHVYKIQCALSDGGGCPATIEPVFEWNKFQGRSGGSVFVVTGPVVTESIALGPSVAASGSEYTVSASDWGPDPGQVMNPQVLPTDGGVYDVPDMFPGYPFQFVFEGQPPDVYWAAASGPSGCQTSPAVYRPSSAGTASLTVTSSQEGDCVVQVLDVGPDDYANDAAHATAIDLGSWSVQTQYPGDLDALSLPVQGGAGYQLDCSGGCALSQSSATSTGWSWFPTDGGVIYSSRSTGTLTFYVGGAIGVHTLDVSQLPDDYPASTSLSPGTTVNGQLEFPQDTDQFQLATTASATYRIDFQDTSGQAQLLYETSPTDARAMGSGSTTFVSTGSSYTFQVQYPASSTPPTTATPYSLTVTAQ